MKQQLAVIDVEINEKIERRDELKELFDSKSGETKITDETVQKELTQLNEKIDDCMLMKKRYQH